MKAKFILLACALCLSLGAFAQSQEEDPTVRYNQYGVPVNRNKLSVEERNGVLVMESADAKYKIWFDSRVQVDGATFFGENEDFDPIGDGLSIRRARFAVKGQVTPAWYAEVDMDFANAAFELKDALVRYTGLKNFSLTAGNFKEGFSMESTTTSRYLPFMERPMIVNTFAPSRHIGFEVAYQNKWLLGKVGAFGQAIEDLETRTNVEDNNKDYGRGSGYSFTGKLVGMPFYKNVNAGLHIGVAGSYRTPKADMATSEFGGVRYSTRNSTSINRKKYLDTDVITNVDHDLLGGLEFAGYFKGLRVQSEYIVNKTYITGKDDPYTFNGWYAHAGFLLFGGRQRYNANEGEFTQPSRGKDWGDVELLVRYEYIDLNSLDVYGGAAQAYTVGLTYFINNNFKMMVNYQYNDNDRYANGKGKLLTGYDASGKATKDYTKIVTANGKAGVDYNMLSIRFELDF